MYFVINRMINILFQKSTEKTTPASAQFRPVALDRARCKSQPAKAHENQYWNCRYNVTLAAALRQCPLIGHEPRGLRSGLFFESMLVEQALIPLLNRAYTHRKLQPITGPAQSPGAF
ncbi:MAG: hypothetical protein PHE83_04990 [Opitutaceae bacterium]|nr:hypothetical protein [Opitutaceae bacterium]